MQGFREEYEIVDRCGRPSPSLAPVVTPDQSADRFARYYPPSSSSQQTVSYYTLKFSGVPLDVTNKDLGTLISHEFRHIEPCITVLETYNSCIRWGRFLWTS